MAAILTWLKDQLDGNRMVEFENESRVQKKQCGQQQSTSTSVAASQAKKLSLEAVQIPRRQELELMGLARSLC